MRELALAGLIAIAFGLGSFYATGDFGVFSAANLGFGMLALVAALARGARRLRTVGGPLSRRLVLRGLAGILAALAVATGLERAAAWSGVQFDWTFERRFELSPGTLRLLRELPGEATATLYHLKFDPRTRRTRLLLEQLAEAGPVAVRERLLDESPQEGDRYAVKTSNTVVLELGHRFETVERPTEGALYEALYHLLSVHSGTLVLLRGEGQGDATRDTEIDFSGLAAALETEGYRVRNLSSAALAEVPEGTDAVVLIAPQRRLLDASIAALRRYLDRGGSLVALLEPGTESGVEALLAEFGIATPDAVLFDPASGGVESDAPALDIVAYSYESHPVTRGLNRNRMTYFRGARAFALRRPEAGAEVERLVLSSPHAWLTEDLTLLEQGARRAEPRGAEQAYHPIVAAGRYPRPGGEARILAFGDSDFASNRYLRALYNLDLILNGVHWAVRREVQITQRPKIRATVQFPLPLNNTLRTFYGVGLLVPELLLVAGGVVWLRRRTA